MASFSGPERVSGMERAVRRESNWGWDAGMDLGCMPAPLLIMQARRIMRRWEGRKMSWESWWKVEWAPGCW